LRTLRRVAEEEIVLVVLLCFFATVYLLAFPPTLLVSDTWLTLASGREIVQHGLPHHETLTVLGLGRTWTDQQWGAQLLFYGADRLGAIPMVVLLGELAVVAAFAVAAIGARRLGAGPTGIVLVFFPVILSSPWAWTVRAQVLALPLYVGLVWLLSSQSRAQSRNVYLAFPILLLWANLHGSAALGAMLTMLLGAVEIVRRGGIGWRQLALLLAAPLLLLATPYGPVATARYYHLLLIDPPFKTSEVTEWNRSVPAVNTLFFYLLAALALLILIRGRRRLTVFDFATLALTFAGAVAAIRGIPWFAMACQVLLPVAIGGKLEERSERARALNRRLATVIASLVLVAVVIAFVRPRGWYFHSWSRQAVDVVRAESADHRTKVFATSGDADWLLWSIPTLRGRVAWDVRFEIYSPETFQRIVRFKGKLGPDWMSLANGYRVVVLESGEKPSPLPNFLREPGARVVYRDRDVTVVRRQVS
jgi:hypothetical protein